MSTKQQPTLQTPIDAYASRTQCKRHKKRHKNLTIIQRVFIENVYHISDGSPSEESNDWYGDPIRWHDPQPISITVTCSDCGFEHIYGPHTPLPKWIRAVWDVSQEGA